MGWNRPNESGDEISRSLQKRSGDRLPAKGAIAGIIVVLGAGIAAWLMWPAEKRGEVAASTKKELIHEVTPAAPKVSEEKPKTYKEMSNDEKLKYWQDRYGDNPPENIKPVIYFLKNPPQVAFRPGRTKASVFKNRSEKIIASALMAEPGAPMLQKPVYDERFDGDFAAHALDAIEIDKDDPDDIKELKRAVIDTKKDMVERVKNGEKASDILNAHMDSLYELGKYKQQITELFGQFRNDPAHTDDDVRDFVTAANKLLKEKGAAEIAMPNLFARQAKLRALARRKEKKEEDK